MGNDEVIAQEGLNIRGYAGKWKRAKFLADRNDRNDEYCLLPYWERVRLLFFELGGERLDGANC